MSTDVAWSRLITGTVLGGVGLLLLVLSASRIVAYSYIAVVPASVVNALKSGQEIPARELEAARDRYFKARSYLPGDAVIEQDLGRLELRRAEAFQDDPERREDALRLASGYFVNSIEVAPGRAFPWGLEALARSRMPTERTRIVGLLRMSYFLGPHEASSILLRARVGTKIWDQLDDDVRQFTSDDLDAIWGDYRLRPALVPIYIDASIPTRIALRKLLFSNKHDEKSFDQMLIQTLAPLDRP